MCCVGHSEGLASVVCAVWLSHAVSGWLASLKCCSNSRLSSEAERWAVGVKQRRRRHHYRYQQTKRFNQMSTGYSLSLITKSFPFPSHRLCLFLSHPSFFFFLSPSFSNFVVDGLDSAASCACWFSLCPIAFCPKAIMIDCSSCVVKQEVAVWCMWICRDLYCGDLETIQKLFQLKMYCISSCCVTDCVKCSRTDHITQTWCAPLGRNRLSPPPSLGLPYRKPEFCSNPLLFHLSMWPLAVLSLNSPLPTFSKSHNDPHASWTSYLQDNPSSQRWQNWIFCSRG